MEEEKREATSECGEGDGEQAMVLDGSLSGRTPHGKQEKDLLLDVERVLDQFAFPDKLVYMVARQRCPELVQVESDVLYFLQGYGVDGVFAVSITLILARDASLADAVMGGSALLAMRHFGEAVSAPLFGWIADRFGARRVFVAAAVMTMLGFVFVAAGLMVAGALVMLLFRGALASLGPAVITQSLAADEEAIGPLARMQGWRDFGAACGPLATGFLLTVLSAEIQHAAMAVAVAAGLFYWLLESGRRP